MCAAVECGALGRCYGTPLALRKMVPYSLVTTLFYHFITPSSSPSWLHRLKGQGPREGNNQATQRDLGSTQSPGRLWSTELRSKRFNYKRFNCNHKHQEMTLSRVFMRARYGERQYLLEARFPLAPRFGSVTPSRASGGAAGGAGGREAGGAGGRSLEMLRPRPPSSLLTMALPTMAETLRPRPPSSARASVARGSAESELAKISASSGGSMAFSHVAWKKVSE